MESTAQMGVLIATIKFVNARLFFVAAKGERVIFSNENILRKRRRMTTGTTALTKMDRNWEDASMHATMMMLVKINAWNTSKADSLNVHVRYLQFFVFKTYFNSGKLPYRLSMR